MTWILATELTDFLRTAVEPQVQVDAIGQGAIFALMAVGIGLVFGVLRLVNFAYGQLIMSGAFALAFASEQDWPVWAGIALCFAVVLGLTLAMDGSSSDRYERNRQRRCSLPPSRSRSSCRARRC